MNSEKSKDVDLQSERLTFEQERLEFKLEKSKEKFFNKYVISFIPHIVTTGCVLITGYFGIQSLQAEHLQSLKLMKNQSDVEAQKRIEFELWQVKYEAYQDALDFVAKYFYCLEWESREVKHKFPLPPPRADDYGKIYGRLRLLTNHPQLVGAFLACLGVEGKEDGSVAKHSPTPSDVDALVKIMREDLGAKKDPTPKRDFALIDFSSKNSVVR